MKNDINIWLERVASLYKSQLRQVAASEGMQVAHLEILQYLDVCNQFSNTAQSLTEYLGQTKSSISQSIKVMEKNGLITREPCTIDKRVSKLIITPLGKQCLLSVSDEMVKLNDEAPETTDVLKKLIKTWQHSKGQAGFGLCSTCRYNAKVDGTKHQCLLMGIELKLSDINKICKEHEFK